VQVSDGEPTVTGTERDVLLATKLYLPGPRLGQVPRPRLLARLDEGLARGPGIGLRPRFAQEEAKRRRRA
jgi:hypothetical protein